MKHTPINIILLTRIARGDSDAFARFYELYYPRVYKFSRYFVKSEEQCHEIVSDLFYNLWQRRKALPEIDNFEGYIYSSVRNLSLKYKKDKASSLHDPLDVLPGDFFVETETPENICMDGELASILEKAINELPERCKLIFLMVREQGLKHKEIAEILSISEHTVHAQMTIASKKISSILKDFYL